MKYTTTVEKDPESNELLITLPQEMLDTLGWKLGDFVQWVKDDNGLYSLVRQENEATRLK